MDWNAVLDEKRARHEALLARGPPTRRRDLWSAALASANWAAGLAALMLGRIKEAESLLDRAADEYRVSADDAPPGSWGRPLAALRCRLLAGNTDVAVDDAERVLMEGAAEAESPIGRYAATLALLTLGRDGEAALHAEGLSGREDFPDDVASALVALADADAPAYDRAVRSVLRSFETRDQYLEDVPVADTVLVLQALAVERGVDATLESQLLPGAGPLA